MGVELWDTSFGVSSLHAERLVGEWPSADIPHPTLEGQNSVALVHSQGCPRFC